MYQFQVASGRGTTGMFAVLTPSLARQPEKQEVVTKSLSE
jgi:hypothetical protein